MGNEWRRWVKLEWLTRFSSETSSKCSGIDLDGLTCGPSPPRRSPADDATSPASKTTSSSTGERLYDKPFDQDVEFAHRSWTRTHGAGVRVFFSRLREQPCRPKPMPAELELWGAGGPLLPNMTTRSAS